MFISYDAGKHKTHTLCPVQIAVCLGAAVFEDN
jgi:hypothetical protein